MLKAGVVGYTPFDLDELGFDGKTVDELNAEIGVDKAVAEAMQAGAMFGFHVPDAFPDVHRKK